MTSLRRNLRLWTVTWFVLQVAVLSALAPRDCCAAHRPAAAAERTCHDAPKATHCPMPAKDGSPCPMHQEQERGHDHGTAPTSSPDGCVMRGTCEGPTFLTVFSRPGVLPEAISAYADLGTRLSTSSLRDNVIGRPSAPDTRPPRL